MLVCAPTGMGKTLIAEAAIFEALHTRKPIYYTTPLIALTEPKFRELGKLVESWGFARDDVGFITGNRRENPDALGAALQRFLADPSLRSGMGAAARRRAEAHFVPARWAEQVEDLYRER